MGKIMIFDKRISGHNLEYIHHLYLGAKQDREYVFAVPEAFEEQKMKFEWPYRENVDFYYLTKEECIEGVGFSNVLHDIKLLRLLIKRYDIERIILINWLLTCIFYFLPYKVRVSGIMYYVYLYEWHKMNLKERAKRIFATIQMICCPQIQDIYILNDETAAVYYNKIYHSRKFKYLPDPLNMPHVAPKDQRDILGIDAHKKVFLHFGSMTSRKGTIEILDSIMQMTPEERQKYHFIFAGIVDDSIRTEFYEKYDAVKNEGVISLYDYFCGYDQIADLCYTCDVLLIPYKVVSNSSGVVAYAAYFKKPVIGPSEGIVGKIIRKYQLGARLETISADCLHSHYDEVIMIGRKAELYIQNNSIDLFNQKILY